MAHPSRRDVTALLASLAAVPRLKAGQSSPASPTTTAQTPEEAPKTIEDAVKQVRKASEALSNYSLPMVEEPAFSFQV